MRKLILYRAHFTNEYVKRIEAAIPPGWHLIQSWKTGAASAAAPDVLCTLSGSPAQQKTQTLKVRFGGGAAAGAFTLPLGKLGEFLESLGKN